MPFFFKRKSQQSLLAQGVKYRILFSFKQDSSKQVFKAVREDKTKELQQEVLLKIFLDKEQFCREEFESLSHVSSPYCVRLFGFENFGDKKALVLEYISGVSLFQLIDNFFLKPEEIDHILDSIYKGLEDLSKQGICHGDLSLDNVLIDENAFIKLIDFGKANYEHDIQGTPPFSAPEIFKGIRANFLSDLYSLGVIDTLLKIPCPLSSLKDMKAEDFDRNNPLLNFDPLKRFYPYKVPLCPPDTSTLKSLSYKVRELLASIESRRCPTVKNSKPKTFSFLNFAKYVFLSFVLVFAGMASSHSYWPNHGWVKIYTNEWFILRVGDIESYTPLTLPLKAGWHSIQWRNKTAKGETKVFVSRGKSLFLNDKSFLIK